MEYEYLEHTSDAKFRAYGEDLSTAFSNAAKALTGLITDPAQVQSTTSHTIELSARNLSSLLYDFLEEVLFLFETEHLLTTSAQVEVQEGEKATLKGTLYGDEREHYPLEGSVKSITYNEMHIGQTDDGGYSITVVIDQ